MCEKGMDNTDFDVRVQNLKDADLWNGILRHQRLENYLATTLAKIQQLCKIHMSWLGEICYMKKQQSLAE